MRQDIKEKWVSALRSDEYKQTQGVLTRLNDDGTPSGHCCLGVLCELAIASGVNLGVDRALGVRTYNGYQGGLPPEVAEWAGIETANNPINSELVVEGSHLAQWNDGGADFNRIADLIEKNL